MHFPAIYAALLSAFVGTVLGYDADFTVYPNAGRDSDDAFSFSRAGNAETALTQTVATAAAQPLWAM